METIKFKTSKLVEDDSLNVSNFSENLDIELDTITVRVSTKQGVYKWEMKNVGENLYLKKWIDL